MSFLAPFYALGVLAVGLPILFHLIQRRPKGQLEFSSTMFLAASPPRLTKRNRLENWPLLLLRAAALILLALAFARPFARSLAQRDAEPPGRQLLVLLDTSASMQREDLWQQALRNIDQLLDDAQPSDQIALATFDSSFTPRVLFEQTSGFSASRRAALVKASLSDVAPTWAATDLGGALVAAADLLHTAAEDTDTAGELGDVAIDTASTSARQSQIVLVSDLQGGSDIEQIKGYQWPGDIRLDIRAVATKQPGNASLSILASGDSTDVAPNQTGELRVRVQNTSDSQQQQFHLGWVADAGTMVEDREYRIQVPRGATRIVRVQRSGSPSSQLVLRGDRHPFDNTVHVASATTLIKQLLYVGDRNEDPRTSLSYYLQRLALDTVLLKVDFQQRLPHEFVGAPDPNAVPLIIVGNAIESEGVNALRSYLATGGRVLCVLHEQAGNRSTQNGQSPRTGQSTDSGRATENGLTQMIRQLTGANELLLDEATVDDYAMFSMIDFQHSLFQPFSDPRFNDFTKIHFWSHRTIESMDLETADRKVLVRFDDRSPALIEQRFGEGRLWLLAAGWQPEESQLALSTKFVPLLYGMFDPTRGRLVTQDNYIVGQPLYSQTSAAGGTKAKQIVYPDGTMQNLAASGPLLAPQSPGVYRLINDALETPFAVNVSSDESSTTPLDVSELEQHGVPIASALTAVQVETKQRQMRDVELEVGQKLWRWLILTALAILGVETLLGGWFSNRQVAEPIPVT